MKLKIPKIKFSARTVIVSCFVLLVCAAAYTDYNIGRKTDLPTGEYLYTSSENGERTKILGEATFVDSNAKTEETMAQNNYDTYFSAMQTNREKSRDEAVQMLQVVVDSADSMPDIKEKAFNEMITIANNITLEANIQSMVMAKGFEDCLAVINGDNLNVIVKTSGLLTNEVAQITEIAMNESGFPAERIKIVEKTE